MMPPDAGRLLTLIKGIHRGQAAGATGFRVPGIQSFNISIFVPGQSMLLRLSGFVKRVRDHLTRPAVRVAPETSCAGLISVMRESAASHALVTDDRGVLLGIVTEQDVLRRVVFDADKDMPVTKIMSAPVHTVNSDEFLYLAIAKMRRLGLRHLPVVDAQARIAGVIDLGAALEVAAAQTVEQIDYLSHEGSIDGLRHTKSAQARLARELLEDAVPAPEILSLLSEINSDLHRRVIDIALNASGSRVEDAPVPFEAVVMGSGGRLESLLNPDQDNGFIIADCPDSEHVRVDAWFVSLAERMVDNLESVGFPRCRGNVMAVNPLWRKRLSEWNDQVSLWLGKSQGVVLRLCDIFFDFRCVYGAGSMSQALRAHVTGLAPQTHFLRELYKVDEKHGPALGLFGRLQTDPLEGPGKGKVNLKLTGTLPIVCGVRILSLKSGLPEVSTLGRIEALHRAGMLDNDEADYLSGAFRHITRLLLSGQLADFEAGQPVGNHVAPENMTRRDKDILVDAFRAVRRLRSRLRDELMGEIF